jgi:hypothetical protein
MQGKKQGSRATNTANLPKTAKHTRQGKVGGLRSLRIAPPSAWDARDPED